MIYIETYAHRAPEMMQYCHIIHHAAQLFVWENVYSYDIDFRLRMACHPERSWGIILQQAWSMRLQERLVKNLYVSGNSTVGAGKTNNSNSANCKICWKYNQGRCTFGLSCKFEDRCGICGKPGHGAHICRKGNGNSQNSHHKEHRDYDYHHKDSSRVEQYYDKSDKKEKKR